jgi:hypothetical protein
MVGGAVVLPFHDIYAESARRLANALVRMLRWRFVLPVLGCDAPAPRSFMKLPYRRRRGNDDSC